MQRAFGLNIPETLNDVYDPARLALIVYDMQVGIVSQIKSGREIVGKVSGVLDAARNAGIRVVFTRHMSLPKQLMGVFQFRMAMAWQRVKSPNDVNPIFLRDSAAFQLVPEMNPLPSEAVFDKLAMSAFEGTPLQFTLRDCGVHSLILCGIALEIGIEPTCRHAADLGIIPILVRDACGKGDAKAADHCVAALEHMGDTIVTDLATITRLLASDHKQ